VSLPVTDSGGAAATSPPGDAAGALEAERVAVDGVATHPSVLDAEPKPSYRDGVQHTTKRALPEWMTQAEREREEKRQSRLSLWQAQRLYYGGVPPSRRFAKVQR
jgi:hypothetical protein